MKVIILVVIAILLTVGVVWVIDKHVPKKLKPVINIVLWVLIIFLGYKTYDSINGEIEFNQLKKERYAVVIEKLKDIRDAELAHKTVTGKYTDNFDNLVKFIDTAEFTITQRRDSSIIDEELTKRYGGVETYKDIVIIDTLGTESVKERLFKNSTRYKTMMNLPEGVAKEGAKFKLQAGVLEEDQIPVFEASVDKSIILFDQDENLVEQEKQVIAVDGVNGSELKVGSMVEVNTNGNWPVNYLTTEE